MDWNAKWIWIEGEEKPRNLFLMCRKSFRLPRGVRSASLAITADTRYALYLNGERIGQGPPRSFPWRQNYDVYDVTSYLRPGENVVAVLVNHYGHSTFQYIQGRGGLLCQIDVETARSRKVIGTNRTWRVKPSEAFARYVPRISVQQAWEEQFDARGELVGWTEIGFDDSDWRRAVEVGEPGCEPWTELVPRDIPFQTDDEVVPVRLMKADAVETVPHQWTVDLEKAFFPNRYDSDRRSVKGFLLFEIHSADEVEIRLRRSHHIMGKLKVNGEESPSGDGTPICLRRGRNTLLFDVSGDYHLMQFSMGLEGEGKLRMRRVAVIGPIGDAETFNRIWESDDPRKALPELVKDVPEEAIAKVDVWSLTCWDRPLEGVEVEMENPDAMLTPNNEWTVIHPPEKGDVRLLLDFGKELLAYTEFELDAPEGTILDFNMFEGIQDGEILLTHGLNNSLRYVCREGRQRYRTYVKRGFRYAFVVFRDLTSPIKIRYIAAKLSTYPTPERGEFYCDDDRLNRIWQIGAYTLRLCMDDTYLDCPAYEQTHWVGDARNEALINWAAFGDPRITAHCLLQTADSLHRSPLPESHVPSGWRDILTAWSLLWVMSVREYWIFTGDRGFLERIYPAVRTTSDNFLGYLNEDGLLEIEAWNMLDWAPMDTPGAGVVTHQNMLLVRALREAAEIADLLDHGDDSVKWRKSADELKEAINRHLWSEEKGAFIDCIRPDGTPSPVISQQTNTMALLCDCVDGERAEKVRQLVLNPPEGVVTAGSPFFMFFLFEQLARDGEIERMLDLTREKWGFMIDKGATTFWETFPGWAGRRWTRSWCHAWSSAPTYFLSTEVLGVCPEKPGFEVVRIAPKPAGLRWCRGRFPTVQGEICVEWRNTEGEFELEAEIPPHLKAHIVLPACDGAKRLTINGAEVKPGELPGGVERVEVGGEGVEIYLARGGRWRLGLTD
jgi:hypothetical protein